MNDKLKDYLNSVETDIDQLISPEKISSREEMGEMFRGFIGYDPTRIWDQRMMEDQIDKLSSDDGFIVMYDDREDAVEKALEHFDAIKPNVMLQIAQKTIKEMFDRDVTADDLNLDLEYLMNSEIFGTGYEDEDDEDSDEEDSSLLDELEEDEDEEFENEEFGDDDDAPECLFCGDSGLIGTPDGVIPCDCTSE